MPCHVLISSYVSVENEHSDAVCIDQLKFYGSPKLAIEGTPFATCSLPTHMWAEDHKVEKYERNSCQEGYLHCENIGEMPGRVQSRFEFHFEHLAQDWSFEN